jgi:hypothetical protein
MSTAASLGVTVGSFVKLQERNTQQEIQDRLDRWIAFYHRDEPFYVVGMIDNNHVSLVGKNGKLLNFGNTGYSSLHVSYVKPLKRAPLSRWLKLWWWKRLFTQK